MSSTKVKKIPFQSDKPYEYDWNQPLKDHTKINHMLIPLANFLLSKEFESVEFIGAENIPDKGKLLIVANHVNGFDPITVMAGMKNPRSTYFMSKSEFFQAFYIRFLMLHLVNGFPVKRGSADREAMKFAVRVLEEGQQMLMIFPQGSRDRYRNRPPVDGEGIKTGFAMIARDAKSDVLPVSIHLESDVEKKHSKCVVRYGEVIKYEDLGFTEGVRKSKEVKAASKLIMTKVQELWDKDQM